MDLLRSLLITLVFVSLGFMIAGFYKPYVVVWWEDIQNRKKVLKIYGTGAIVFFVLYLLQGYLM